MQDFLDPDETTLTIVRNSLRTVEQSPRIYRRVLQRAGNEQQSWIPALIRLAIHEHPATVRLAVRILIQFVQQTQDMEWLAAFGDLLPRQTSALASVAADVAEKLVTTMMGMEESNAEVAAKRWNNFSERCHDADRRELALQCAERAARLGRRLSFDNPEHQRIRILTLLTLAKRQSQSGQADPALETAGEAFALAEDLPADSPELKSLVVQAASIYANRLAELGHVELALEACKFAKNLCLQLPANDQQQYDLAIAELSIANSLVNLGRHEAALPYAENAERIFRILSGDNPDAFLEYTAAAAGTYAQCLTCLGRLNLAYGLSLQNVDRMGKLARRQPRRFGFEFAAHVINLTDCATDVGDFAAAIRLGRRGLALARAHGRRMHRRNWFLEGQASNNLFRIHYRLGHFRSALRHIQNAARCFGLASRIHSEAVLEKARVLRGLAEAQRMTGGLGRKAVSSARKAIACLMARRQKQNEAHRLLEAQCRTTLSACLEDAGQVAAAINEERRSLGLRRKLMTGSVESYRTDVAFSLTQLARQLLRSAEIKKAIALVDEALGYYELARSSGPERLLLFMAEAFRVKAEAEVASHQNKKAVETLARGIGVVRQNFDRDPNNWLKTLQPLCARYLQLCANSGVNPDYPLVEPVIAKTQKLSQHVAQSTG